MTTRLRVLVGKPGLDGHDRGALVVCRALRDAGHEVIYTGRRRTPAEIAATAVQEDVDVVGLSILSGAHVPLVAAVLAALAELGAADVPVVLGGTVLKAEEAELLRMGVAAVFPTGSTMAESVAGVERVAAAHDEGRA